MVIKVVGSGFEAVNKKIDSLSVGIAKVTAKTNDLEHSFRKLGVNINGVDASGIGRVGTTTQHLDRTIEDTNRDLNTLNRNLGNVNTRGIESANEQAQHLNSSLGDISKLAIGGLLTGALTGFIRSTVDAQARVQSLKAQIRSIGDDVETTYSQIRDMSNENVGLNTDGAVRAYSAFRRIGQGAEESKESVISLGKGIASFGGDSNALSGVMMQIEQLANKTNGFTQDLNAISNYLPNVKSVIMETFNVSDLEELGSKGITGKDIVGAITSHYGELDVPFDGLNASLNRLNASIEEIKANAGAVFEPLVSSLSKLLQVASKFSQNDLFASAITSITTLVGFVGGIYLLNKAFQTLRNTGNEVIGMLQQLGNISRTNSLSQITQHLQQIGEVRRTDNHLMGDDARALRETVEYRRDNPTQQGGLSQELRILREIREERNAILQLQREDAELSERIARNEREMATYQSQRTVLRNRKDEISNQINNLTNERDNTTDLSKRTQLQRRINELKDQEYYITQQIRQANRGIRDTELEREHLNATRRFQTTPQAVRDVNSAYTTQAAIVQSKVMDGFKTASPYITMAIMTGANYLARVFGQEAEKVKQAFLSSNVNEMAKVSREADSRAGWKEMKGQMASYGNVGGGIGAGIGAVAGSLLPGIGTAIGGVLGGAIGYLGGALTGMIASWTSSDRTTEFGRIAERVETNNRPYDEQIKQMTRQGKDTTLQEAWLDAKKAAEMYRAYVTSDAYDPNDKESVKRQEELAKVKEETATRYLNLQSKEIENNKQISLELQKQVHEIQKKSNDLNSDIISLRFELNGDDFNAQLEKIKREYEKVNEEVAFQNSLQSQILQDENATNEQRELAGRTIAANNLELEKALLTYQKQTAELEKQQYIQKEKINGQITANEHLFNGNKYAADMARIQANLNVKLAQAKTLEERILAVQEAKIEKNKADLGLMDRINTLKQNQLRFEGRGNDSDKLGILNNMWKVTGDITADKLEKENAIMIARNNLLDQSINKIKQYYSHYTQGLNEVINKQKEAINGAIEHAKSYRDAILGMFSEGQQSLFASHYFNTDRAYYSDEELKQGYMEYQADKNYKEDLEKRTDKLLFGGSTESMETLVKRMEDTNKYAELNNITGMELLKLLQQWSPYIQGSGKLFEEAYNTQMSF